MFSKSCQYALQAVLYINLNGDKDKPIKIRDISDSQEIPIHFLGKILQILVKANILESYKGPTGGFVMGEAQGKLTLFEIVKVVDGLDIFNKCGIGLKSCSDDCPCPVHNDFKIVKQKIRSLLNDKTIDDLCCDVNEGNSIVSFFQN